MKVPVNVSEWRWYHRIMYRVSHRIQSVLWKIGISWHNSIGGECTPDFSCCTGRKTGKTGLAALVDLLESEGHVVEHRGK
jgi:hypothetical protein